MAATLFNEVDDTLGLQSDTKRSCRSHASPYTYNFPTPAFHGQRPPEIVTIECW